MSEERDWEEGPIAGYALGGDRLARDVGCAAFLLLPLAAAALLLPFDPVRALGALVMGVITGGLAAALFGHALRRDLVLEVRLHRDALHARTRSGWVVVPWRALRRVTWSRVGDRWLGSEVITADGGRLRVTPWLEDGRACAFLLHHAAEKRSFPWAYLGAADWAAPDHIDLDGGAPAAAARAVASAAVASPTGSYATADACARPDRAGASRTGTTSTAPRSASATSRTSADDFRAPRSSNPRPPTEKNRT